MVWGYRCNTEHLYHLINLVVHVYSITYLYKTIILFSISEYFSSNSVYIFDVSVFIIRVTFLKPPVPFSTWCYHFSLWYSTFEIHVRCHNCTFYSKSQVAVCITSAQLPFPSLLCMWALGSPIVYQLVDLLCQVFLPSPSPLSSFMCSLVCCIYFEVITRTWFQIQIMLHGGAK